MLDEAVTWRIHAGRAGDGDTLFLKRNVVTFGGAKVGDLARLPPDREVFKQRFAQAYPEKKPGASPTSAGRWYRFVRELKMDEVLRDRGAERVARFPKHS